MKYQKGTFYLYLIVAVLFVVNIIIKSSSFNGLFSTVIEIITVACLIVSLISQKSAHRHDKQQKNGQIILTQLDSLRNQGEKIDKDIVFVKGYISHLEDEKLDIYFNRFMRVMSYSDEFLAIIKLIQKFDGEKTFILNKYRLLFNNRFSNLSDSVYMDLDRVLTIATRKGEYDEFINRFIKNIDEINSILKEL